jgi:hypothetical protein
LSKKELVGRKNKLGALFRFVFVVEKLTVEKGQNAAKNFMEQYIGTYLFRQFRYFVVFFENLTLKGAVCSEEFLKRNKTFCF